MYIYIYIYIHTYIHTYICYQRVSDGSFGEEREILIETIDEDGPFRSFFGLSDTAGQESRPLQ